MKKLRDSFTCEKTLYKMENYELRITNYQLFLAKILCILCILCSSVFSVRAQSTSQNFPTPIIANEISGRIAARDLGDARLTNYFYVFNGNQGDVFINAKTSNLDGDIDVFIADNLRPLTKITVFSGASENETGRVIYLRKPEKLILRIQGRTPNDNPAIFNLKFAGSFAPAPSVAESDAPELPEVKTENPSDVQVNSVGTIISVKPKPTPQPKEEIAAENEPKKDETPPVKVENRRNKSPKNKPNTDATAENTTAKVPKKTPSVPRKSDVVVTDTSAEENASNNKTGEETSSVKKTIERAPGKTSVKKQPRESRKPTAPNPLENVHLIILFKDGTKIERAMSEVLRVGVDKGVLTLITKNGAIARYQILDVAKMTIE